MCLASAPRAVNSPRRKLICGTVPTLEGGTMIIEEKFYLLVLDEVRSQPDLAQSLPVDIEALALQCAGCSLDTALGRLHQRPPCEGGRGFEAVHSLAPPPAHLTTSSEELERSLGTLLPANYEKVCRDALACLVWLDFKHAEERINLAKFLKDEWAFAHFLYGLLRGLDGEMGKAHFELYLAINRETYISARQRVDRALSLVR